MSGAATNFRKDWTESPNIAAIPTSATNSGYSLKEKCCFRKAEIGFARYPILTKFMGCVMGLRVTFAKLPIQEGSIPPRSTENIFKILTIKPVNSVVRSNTLKGANVDEYVFYITDKYQNCIGKKIYVKSG